MKLQIFLTIVIVILVAGTTAQFGGLCRQRARPTSCVGLPDVGVACPTAPPRRMWFFNPVTRTCAEMIHLGCGGNANRFCSPFICRLKCNRLIG